MKNHQIEPYDAAIIGGGFYGCMIALYLGQKLKNVVIIEKEGDLLLKASYNNQARIHHGFHYPRSVMTTLRSQVNYSKFIADFKPAVVDNFTKIYAIANGNSKTTASQFLKFCSQSNLPIIPASEKIKAIFNERLIEEAFIVEEVAFNATILRQIFKRRLSLGKIKILYGKEVSKVVSKQDNLYVSLTDGNKLMSKVVINCAYANINSILRNSSLPPLPLKNELTEMPLIKMPPKLRNVAITIMDGPFFSLMPFPPLNLHTIHHVRYTPHISLVDTTRKNKKMGRYIKNTKVPTKSRFIYMIKDIARYIPQFTNVGYRGSIYETKTVLIQNEVNDARPILFKKHYGIKNFHVVLGAKLDNVYDVINEIKHLI